jgi:hypothetical protein
MRLHFLFAACTVFAAFAHGAETGPVGPFSLDSDRFPIGLFSVDHPGAMTQARGFGVGYVHTYANGRSAEPEQLARDAAYMDAAQERGLQVMYNLNGRRYVGRSGGLDEFRRIVAAVKDHPALGFWYLYDEPDRKHTAAEIAPFYEALKEMTPDVPVAVATAWSERWYAYQDVLDILMIDLYPVQHRPFPQSKLNNMTTFTRNALSKGKPVMPINQCMNWKILAGDKEEYRGSPVAELRYPNADELRYLCYSGLVQGVRGMFWWSYYRSVQLEPRWMREVFGPVVREFAGFTRLVAPAHDALRFERAADSNLLMALWQRESGDYLVLVNAWPLEQAVTRWMEDRIESARLTPVGGTRDSGATLTRGRLNVGMVQPWEVLVWQLADVTTSADVND